MQRRQVLVPGAANQATQQGFMDMRTGRHDREEMRLVRDQQICIFMQHDFIERNRRFVGNFAVVMNLKPDPMRCFRRQESSFAIDHASARHALQPLPARHRRETFAQAIEHRRPRPRRQLQRARGKTIDVRRMLSHVPVSRA